MPEFSAPFCRKPRKQNACFGEALTILRSRATDSSGKGRAFTRLMRMALTKEPGSLGDRFEHAWLRGELPDRDGPDIGIEYLAKEREGSICAIQCKILEYDRYVSKKAIESFIDASEPSRHTSRLTVNTVGSVQGNALHQLQVRRRGEDAAPQLALREHGEEALREVGTGRSGGQEMHEYPPPDIKSA